MSDSVDLIDIPLNLIGRKVIARSLFGDLKHVASSVIQDSQLFGMIHCGSKENRGGQAFTDGIA